MVSQCRVLSIFHRPVPFHIFSLLSEFMEEISGANNYMIDTEEWMMNKLIIICFSERIRNYKRLVDYIYHSYTKDQLSIVGNGYYFK